MYLQLHIFTFTLLCLKVKVICAANDLSVFYEALQDQRALQLLEKFMPRRKILAMLNKTVDCGKMDNKSERVVPQADS